MIEHGHTESGARYGSYSTGTSHLTACHCLGKPGRKSIAELRRMRRPIRRICAPLCHRSERYSTSVRRAPPSGQGQWIRVRRTATSAWKRQPPRSCPDERGRQDVEAGRYAYLPFSAYFRCTWGASSKWGRDACWRRTSSGTVALCLHYSDTPAFRPPIKTRRCNTMRSPRQDAFGSFPTRPAARAPPS